MSTSVLYYSDLDLLCAKNMPKDQIRRVLAVGAGIMAPLASAILAQQVGRWDLFERSGSFTTAIGLVLASRRDAQYTPSELASLPGNPKDLDIVETLAETITSKLGLALSAFGTIIWGWGSYLGWWSFGYLLIWALFALHDLRRDSRPSPETSTAVATSPGGASDPDTSTAADRHRPSCPRA